VFDKYQLSETQRKYLPNDDTARIKSRTAAAFTATVFSISAVFKILKLDIFNSADRELFWKVIGLSSASGSASQLTAINQSLALIGTLFAGPILQLIIQDETALYHVFENDPWITFKNLFVAPVTEETVYRACLLPLLYRFYSYDELIYITPIFFGVAHIHHLYHKIAVQKMSWKVSLLITLFQFSYTTIFGSISTFVYLRTASLPAVIAMHSFCNLFGFPDFAGVVSETSRVKKVVLGVAYVGGLCGFFYACRHMVSAESFGNVVF